MAGRSKNSNIEPSIFRAMIEQFPYKQITVDFATKEEALEYVHSLTSNDTTWYGLYERSPIAEYLLPIEHKRLRPYDDTLPEKISTDNTKQRKERRRRVR